MILDIVKVKDDTVSGEMSINRNGRLVGSIKMSNKSNTITWSISFGGKEIILFNNSSRATTDLISAFEIQTSNTFSGMCYQVHEGGLFSKYDIYELRYQSLPYKLYPIALADSRTLPVYYGNWQVASIENETGGNSLFRNAQILAEDEKAALVAFIFFCYTRSNPAPLSQVTNKKLLGKIDPAFPTRIQP